MSEEVSAVLPRKPKELKMTKPLQACLFQDACGRCPLARTGKCPMGVSSRLDDRCNQCGADSPPTPDKVLEACGQVRISF